MTEIEQLQKLLRETARERDEANARHAAAHANWMTAERLGAQHMDALEQAEATLKEHLERCGSCFALTEATRKLEAAEATLKETQARVTAMHLAEGFNAHYQAGYEMCREGVLLLLSNTYPVEAALGSSPQGEKS